MYSRRDVLDLIRVEADPAISLFLPTHEAGREIRQDPIRLRRLLDEARGALGSRGVGGADADRLLRAGYRLLEDGAFWRHQSRGLALFLARDRAITHHLPVEVPEGAFVDDHFHVRPLLPALAADGRYVVLMISLKDLRIWQGSRHRFDLLPLSTLPRGTEGLFGQEPRAGDGTVPKPVTANSGDAPAYARGGGQNLVTNDEVATYTTQIARAVEGWLGGTATPLVVIADERVGGRFDAACTYPHLVRPLVFDLPDGTEGTALHAMTYAKVRPVFEQALDGALDRFRMLAGDGSGRGLDVAEKVVEAAAVGRVEHLFLREGAEVWGRFLPESMTALAHEHRKDGDSELLDIAAARVLLTDGQVHTLPADRMPTGQPAAAILRY